MITFSKGKGKYKYTAIITHKNGEEERVSFGHKDYQQYHDKIGLYSHLDHLDKERRKRYRQRHMKILLKDGRPAYKVRYTPAYLSLKYLW